MNVKKTVLKNGLTIITDEIQGFESVSLGLFVGVGAINENKCYGISHFVEHMAFKGTDKRTAEEISEQIENVGGAMNAYTSKERTVFYTKMLKNDIELGLDIVLDIVQHPSFKKVEFDKEKGVIIQEIKMYNDTPDSLVFDIAQEIAFGDSNLGRNILGTEQTVTDMTTDDLFSYINEYYTSNQMVLSVSGACNHEQVVELANKYIDNMCAFDAPQYEQQKYYGGFRCVKKEIEQANIVFAFESLKNIEDKKHIYTILSVILGGGMSSRLFRTIREDKGLVYSVFAFNSSYRDTGKFGVYAGCDAQNLKQVIDISLEQMNDVKKNITSAELERAKTQLKSSLLMGMESSSTRMKMFGNTWLQYGKILDIQKEKDVIDSTTMEQVQEFAEQIFKGKMTVAVVSGEDEDKLSWINDYVS